MFLKKMTLVMTVLSMSACTVTIGDAKPGATPAEALQTHRDNLARANAATVDEVRENQRFVARYPICKTLPQIRETAATFAQSQLKASGIGFIPESQLSEDSLPSGCYAGTIPPDVVSDGIGRLNDRDGDWSMPVARLIKIEPEDRPYENTFYGYVLFPDQARLVRQPR